MLNNIVKLLKKMSDQAGLDNVLQLSKALCKSNLTHTHTHY